MLNTLGLALLSLSVCLFMPNIKQKLASETRSQLWVLWLFIIFFIGIYFYGIEVSLFAFMLFSSIFYAYDWFVLKQKTKSGEKNLLFHLVDFFPVLLVIWLIRSFLFQPYQVPTGSLEPTVRPGDFLIVNQYDFGIRMPIWHKLLVPIASPKRGDLVVFFPPEGKVHYVKRLIGVPGDVIQYKQKQVYINGKLMPQTLVGPGYAEDPGRPVVERTEQIGGVNHSIFVSQQAPAAPAHTWIVPAGHYFMMGDNRDFSGDSREFGFVPEANIVGRPLFIWFSFDAKAWAEGAFSKVIRWHRIGHKVV